MQARRAIGAIIVLAAATAGAAVYVDERFEGAVPPPGWKVKLQDGEWTGSSGGHPGRCARGEVRPEFRHLGYAQLITPSFNVGAGRTVYYRFYYRAGYSGGAYYTDWVFAFSYEGGSSFIASFILPAAASWTLREGSVRVARAEPVLALWDVGGVYQNYPQAIIWMELDTAQLSDEQFTAVAPTSLGRVRALFQ